MLSLICGAFHPELEKALIQHIKGSQKPPYKPSLLVVPSSHLLKEVQHAFLRHRLSVINLHMQTFSSVPQSILQSEDEVEFVLHDAFFYDAVMKQILKQERSPIFYEELALPEGFPTMVRSTIRDLMDAGIPAGDPTILEAIKEAFLGGVADVGMLLELLRHYEAYVRRLKNLNVHTFSDVMRRAKDLVPSSTYLRDFKSILFYGFTDFTGLQKELFEAVVRAYPSFFYLPYIHRHPAYQSVTPFRETHLLPLADNEVHLPDQGLDDPASTLHSKQGKKQHTIADQPNPPAESPIEMYPTRASKVRIINVSGLQDEAAWVAAEILRLHDQEDIPYHEMAVVARVIDRLRMALFAAFKERHIPFTSSASARLRDFPFVELILKFLETAESGEEARLLDDISSMPDFLMPDKLPMKLADILPASGTWEEYARKTKTLLETYFRPVSDLNSLIYDRLLNSLFSLTNLALLSPSVKRKEFLETLRDRWSSLEIKEAVFLDRGVSLLHAEAARGAEYQVIFIVGVEERVFPRIIREDPFLKDEARLALSNTLGYKIARKNAGLEEERLLFHLLCSGAKKKLYLTYQRTNEEGQVVGASTFLRVLALSQGIDLEKDAETLPRSTSAKMKALDLAFASPREAVHRMLLARHLAGVKIFFQSLGWDKDGFEHRIAVTGELRHFDVPGPYDGVLAPKTYAELFGGKSVSATALETYGRCPFQFFIGRILDIEPREKMELLTAPPPDKKGKIIHAFLENFYRAYFKPGQRQGSFPEEIFEDTFRMTIESVSPKDVQMLSLLWDICRHKLKEELRQYLSRDLSWLNENGYRPIIFEKKMVFKIEELDRELIWEGHPDRVDRKGGAVRIIDYKTGSRIPAKPLDACLKGIKHQPPVYFFLVERYLQAEKDPVQSLHFSYQKLGDEFEERTLTWEEWGRLKPEILKTIQEQLALMKKGTFLLFPDNTYCNWCPYQTICRQDHGPTLFRVQKGAGEGLRQIRMKSVES